MAQTWYVYMLRCKDGSLYTGITTDLKRRVSEHNSASGGAKYTLVRQPVALVYHEVAASRSLALQREYALKQLSKSAKERLTTTRQS
jgi:putative endonuclease